MLPLRLFQKPPAESSGVKDQSPWGEDALSPKYGLVPANPVYKMPVLRLAQMPPWIKLGTPEGFGLEIKVTEVFVQSLLRSIESNVLAAERQKHYEHEPRPAERPGWGLLTIIVRSDIPPPVGILAAVNVKPPVQHQGFEMSARIDDAASMTTPTYRSDTPSSENPTLVRRQMLVSKKGADAGRQRVKMLR